jgi:Fic family protein
MTRTVFLKTLETFCKQPPQIPMSTVWLLSDLAEYRGKQELFTKQSPQKLAKLKEHAIIESAISSNRIEGVEIDKKRVGTVVFGKGLLQDREEEEVRGYQSALTLIHGDSAELVISPATIKRLHSMTRPNIWDSGMFKKDDGEIIETHPNGRVTVRFNPTSAAEALPWSQSGYDSENTQGLDFGWPDQVYRTRQKSFMAGIR